MRRTAAEHEQTGAIDLEALPIPSQPGDGDVVRAVLLSASLSICPAIRAAPRT
jgi:hypothetical protein